MSYFEINKMVFYTFTMNVMVNDPHHKLIYFSQNDWLIDGKKMGKYSGYNNKQQT